MINYYDIDILTVIRMAVFRMKKHKYMKILRH